MKKIYILQVTTRTGQVGRSYSSINAMMCAVESLGGRRVRRLLDTPEMELWQLVSES